MTDLLPCPFCGGAASFDNELSSIIGKEKVRFIITCKNCGIGTYKTGIKDVAIREWNTRADLVSTPNKPAEVDLDALKKPEPVFYDGYSEYRRGYERGKQLGWNDCIDHLATGKGGGVAPYGDNEPCKYCGAHSDDLTIAYMAGQASQKPAAPTQIDAEELEAAIMVVTEANDAEDAVDILECGSEIDIVLQAARAHLAKSKGGV